MKKANVIFDVILIMVAGFFFYKTFSFPEGIGSGGIGPASFPQIILLSIVIVSVLDLIIAFMSNINTLFLEGIDREKGIRFGIVVGSMLLMIFFLGKIPFIIISTIILFVQCLILKFKLLPAVITSLALSVSVYLIFVKGFGVLL